MRGVSWQAPHAAKNGCEWVTGMVPAGIQASVIQTASVPAGRPRPSRGGGGSSWLGSHAPRGGPARSTIGQRVERWRGGRAPGQAGPGGTSSCGSAFPRTGGGSPEPLHDLRGRPAPRLRRIQTGGAADGARGSHGSRLRPARAGGQAKRATLGANFPANNGMHLTERGHRLSYGTDDLPHPGRSGDLAAAPQVMPVR
jgi:hypothetical protein